MDKEKAINTDGFEIGDQILIETDKLVIKEATVTDYFTSLNKSTITVEYCDQEVIEIDIDDIIRVEGR